MIEIERTVKPVREMSLIPLINVVLLLLIFFLVAGTLDRFEVLRVDPPIATAGDEINQGPIVIVLGRYEEMLIDDDLITPDELKEAVTKRLKVRPDRLITVKADARMPADKLIEVLDEINAAGGKQLTIATQRP